MSKFKVFALKTESIYAIVEANSAEEAEILADENFEEYTWKEADSIMETTIEYGDTYELTN